MPLIPYPNVPALPGVPPLPSIPGVTLPSLNVPPIAAQSLALVSTPLPLSGASDFGTPWAIVDASGNIALQPDSVLSFDYKGDSCISKYPVEGGGFASYNKVLNPVDCRIVMACNGQGKTAVADFLAALETMRQGTALFSITTPDALYANMNLIHFDYRREARNGFQLVTVDAGFEEVRTTAATAYSNTAQASDADQQSVGKVSAASPSSADQSMFNASAVV